MKQNYSQVKRQIRNQNEGKRKKKEYLVKWLGYPTPDWQPAENLEDTEALQDWLDGRKED